MYDITVVNIFTAANVQFMPGHQYTVSDEIYNGKTDDGRDFKAMCNTAQPSASPQQQQPTG
jgi:hypothetical protein